MSDQPTFLSIALERVDRHDPGVGLDTAETLAACYRHEVKSHQKTVNRLLSAIAIIRWYQARFKPRNPKERLLDAAYIEDADRIQAAILSELPDRIEGGAR